MTFNNIESLLSFSKVQEYIKHGKKLIRQPLRLLKDDYKIYFFYIDNSILYNIKEIRKKINRFSFLINYYDSNNITEYIIKTRHKYIFLYNIDFRFFNESNLEAINNNKNIEKIFLMGEYHSYYEYPLQSIDMQPFLTIKKNIEINDLKDSKELRPILIHNDDFSKEYVFFLADLSNVNILDTKQELQYSFKRLNNKIRQLYIFLQWKFKEFYIFLKDKEFHINIKDINQNFIYHYQNNEDYLNNI